MPYTFTAMWNKHSPAYVVTEKLSPVNAGEWDRRSVRIYLLPFAVSLSSVGDYSLISRFSSSIWGQQDCDVDAFPACEICDHSGITHDHWLRLPSLNHLKTTPGWHTAPASAHVRPLVYNTDTLWEREMFGHLHILFVHSLSGRDSVACFRLGKHLSANALSC